MLTWWLSQISFHYPGEIGFFILVKSSETVALDNSYVATTWGTLNQIYSVKLLVFVWGINTDWKYLNIWNSSWIRYVSNLSPHIKHEIIFSLMPFAQNPCFAEGILSRGFPKKILNPSITYVTFQCSFCFSSVIKFLIQSHFWLCQLLLCHFYWLT